MTTPPTPSVTWEHDAVVYETDASLCDSVAEFLADGLRASDTVVVLATTAHRDLLIERLAARGHNWTRAVGARRLWWVEARQALEFFMMGRKADAARFEKHIGGLLASCRAAFPSGRIRAYGEMVDLLWREGHPEEALRVEHLWNGLAGEHDFALLCAHTRGNLYRESSGLGYRHVCETHRRVLDA